MTDVTETPVEQPSFLKKKKGPVVLIIMDGLGNNTATGPEKEWDAVDKADAPFLKSMILHSKMQGRYLPMRTDGHFVGLPGGQMGNSEVGHSTIGAGRVIKQSLTIVHEKLEDGSLFDAEGIQKTLKNLQESGGTLHLFGLLSEGGVHSHIDHVIALAKYFDAQGVPVAIHAALDGRDVGAKSAESYLKKLQEGLKDCSRTKLATISGRAYSMDRVKNWDQIRPAYDAITFAEGTKIRPDQIHEYIEDEYARQKAHLDATGQAGIVSDENVPAAVMEGYEGIGPKDGLLVANFRTDRAKQISQALIDPASLADKGFRQKFTQSDGRQFSRDFAAGMTEYSDVHKGLMQSVLVVPEEEKALNVLSEVIANAQPPRSQLHLAETEKYAHVTRFINGRDKMFGPKEGPGKEVMFKIDSPALAPGQTYADFPAMSSTKVTEKLKEALNSNEYDYIVVNYAQPDMIGHTGDFKAAVGAVEAMDKALAEVVPLIRAKNGTAVVIADHGNVEQMKFADGTPHTQHTTFPVHMMIEGRGIKAAKRDDSNPAGLADIAPTILDLMGLEKPKEMTGESLVSREKFRSVT